MSANGSKASDKTNRRSSIRKTMPNNSQPIVYCWNCAKDGTNQKCSKCIRCFHQMCVGNHPETDWACDECRNGGDFESFDLKFIPTILCSIRTCKQFEFLVNKKFANDETIKAIDLKKMEGKKYEDVAQFEEDLKWFIYNCRTIYPRDFEVEESEHELVQYVKEIIQYIRHCAECVEGTCSKLHLVVWAKIKLYRYWPGKVIAVDSAKKTVSVRFFRYVSLSTLPAENCFLYSLEDPETKIIRRSNDYEKAMIEVNDYINHARAHFGGFNCAMIRQALEPEKVQDYFKQMFPGALMALIPNVSATNASSVNVNSEITNQNKKRKISIKSTLTNGSVTQNPNDNASDQLADLWKRNFDDMKRNAADWERNFAHWENVHRSEMGKLEDENKKLKEEIANAKEEQRSEKAEFEDNLREKNIALEEVNRQLKQVESEKTVLENRVAEEQKRFSILEETYRREKQAAEEEKDALMNDIHTQLLKRNFTPK